MIHPLESWLWHLPHLGTLRPDSARERGATTQRRGNLARGWSIPACLLTSHRMCMIAGGCERTHHPLLHSQQSVLEGEG